MKRRLLIKDKRAQVATTITWIVATIIIVVILGISIFATSLLGRRTYDDRELEQKTDLLVTKSLLSYLLTKQTDKTNFEKIAEEEKFNPANEDLKNKIFNSLYEREYPFSVLVKLNTFKMGGIEISSDNPRVPESVIERVKIINDLWIEANTIN